jgi:peptidoglycan/xylan/chitin deacetylase (PgdA/CDA1 family)
MLGFRLLRLTLIPVLIRHTLQRERVTLLLYHDPAPATLDRHLEILKQLYSIIDLRTYVSALCDGTTSKLPHRALVVTLDDGYRGNRSLLPVLERLGVPVTIFLCASIVGTKRRFWFKHARDVAALKRVSDSERLERLARDGFSAYGEECEALSNGEIREMSGPHVDFQSHGLSHPILPHCGRAKARAEIFESKDALDTRYGLDIYAFSYPNGDYTEREVRLVREAGYRCGVTVDLGFNTGATDPFRIRRICIADADGIDELLVKCCGLWGAIRRVLDCRRLMPRAASGDCAVSPVRTTG